MAETEGFYETPESQGLDSQNKADVANYAKPTFSDQDSVSPYTPSKVSTSKPSTATTKP